MQVQELTAVSKVTSVRACLGTQRPQRPSITRRSRLRSWLSRMLTPDISSEIYAPSKCSWTRKSCAAGERLVSRGSSMISGTATVHTTSSISVRTAWHVQNAASICPRIPRGGICWRARRTWCNSGKRFLSATQRQAPRNGGLRWLPRRASVGGDAIRRRGRITARARQSALGAHSVPVLRKNLVQHQAPHFSSWYS
jgi:hypothetical protein